MSSPFGLALFSNVNLGLPSRGHRNNPVPTRATATFSSSTLICIGVELFTNGVNYDQLEKSK